MFNLLKPLNKGNKRFLKLISLVFTAFQTNDKYQNLKDRGDRGIMGHGELRTSVIFLKTVSNYCPKTFFFEFSYSSPIFGTPVELRTRILTEL